MQLLVKHDLDSSIQLNGALCLSVSPFFRSAYSVLLFLGAFLYLRLSVRAYAADFVEQTSYFTLKTSTRPIQRHQEQRTKH